MSNRLPIDDHLPTVLSAVKDDGAVVVVAEPGAGKTTRVPPALLSLLGEAGDILVLQPRRIACRLSAERVAQELGERVGERVGYQVRFEEQAGPRTRIRFVTEGILTRRLGREPELPGVAAVVLDEFHERSLHADFALACIRRLRNGPRPDLRLVVMSATLDAEPLARFLACQVCAVPGRTFPVEVNYQQAEQGTPLERRVARGLAEVPPDGGDVLVFLPGAAEIRRAAQLVGEPCRRNGRELLFLHGDLPPREQDRAVRSGDRPKMILSTNIAETSLTLPGVTTVIDSGLARVAAHSPFSGLPTLTTAAISQASAIQRAGRAGRVGPGRCLRLYTEHEFRSRPTHDRPELLRADLCDLALHLVAVGGRWADEDWLVPPAPKALASARELLVDLGALVPQDGVAGAAGQILADVGITDLGRRMLRLPVHPRLARLVLEAEERGVSLAGATVASLLSERDVSLAGRSRFDGHANDLASGPSDLLQRIELVERLEAVGFDESVARQERADAAAARRVVRARKRLLPRGRGQQRPPAIGSEADEEALGLAVLAAFPDRVAKRRRPGAPEVVFGRGGAATLAEESVVREAEFLVAVDATEGQGRNRGVRINLACQILPEWLLELFAPRIEDRAETRFDPVRGRVDTYRALCFEGLVLDESRSEASDEEAAQALLAVAQERGLGRVFDLGSAEAFFARWAFAAERGKCPAPPEEGVLALARHACMGARSLDDLAQRNLTDYLSLLLSPTESAALEQAAPAYVQLPAGRRLQVQYPPDSPPYVASRMQDFFGMATGPSLAGKPLVLHLLAPNQRPVQVTDDLAGFWERHYPELRKALARRYPKHPFPDDPKTAAPPPRRPRRV